ncbi:Hachiman antiphage defense system protein HamA [Polaribacter sp. 20A6]|uniref:Hachiman antiphage defense system protein HamA n=1 Tax=Polaribacter sp. 20A6 TaxID=2687289 RepID=UPI0013FDF3D5|nr:Hachiman antiphage defense system protein HamA [Polaribacter sp. 20A6]
MPWTTEHNIWLTQIPNQRTTVDGKAVTLLEFNPNFDDTETMSRWAKHFRNHYCFDTEIDFFREGTGLSKKDFLLNTKFPTTTRGFGPGIRAGDFGEILIADYLAYTLDHWVPRTRYGNKTIRDESTKGSDLIGFKTIDDTESIQDILTMFEVKTQFSGTKTKPRLQDAINDSIKDELRKAESLNAMKQRLYDKGNLSDAQKISRYQNPIDKPYTEKYGAAALFSDNIYNEEAITQSSTQMHPYKNNLFLIVIKGGDLMSVVNHLYSLSANEA